MTKQGSAQRDADGVDAACAGGSDRLRPPRWTRIGTRATYIVVAVLVVVMGLTVLGAFVPNLPAVGIVGSALSGFAGWLGLAALAVLATAVVLSLRRPGRWRYLTAAVAALSLIGCVVISARLIAVGNEYGVSINPLGGAPSASPPNEMVQYGDHDGEALDVAIWEPTTSADTRSAPVAFFVHGGGWVSGTNVADASGLKAKMADAGWLVVSVGYTLAGPSRHTWDVVENQVGCAMAWTARNAPRYGADATTFVVLGESAGGNLAINTSYRANSGDLTCASQGAMPKVDAVTALYPGVDPYALYDDTVPPFGEPGRTFMQQYIGGSPQQLAQAYEAVKSSNHVDASSPPTLVFQGDNDHLVQPHGVYDFANGAASAGVDISLVRIPYGEHGFDASPMGSQLVDGITFDWLHAHGFTG